MKKNYIIGLILLGFFMAVPVHAQNEKKFYKVGLEFLNNNKSEDAISQFSKAIDLDPEYVKSYESRALAFEKIHNYTAALDDLEKLIIFDAKNEEYSFNAARMCSKLGDFPKSLVHLNLALEKKRIYPEAQQLKVNVLMELEKYNDALVMAKEALKYKENDINFYNYGRVNEKVGLWNEAEDAYNKAIKKRSSFLEAYVGLADLQRKRENLSVALATCNKAIKIDKNYVPAYKVRSAVYADQLNYSAAINDVSTILLMEPENGEMFFLRGKYYQGYAQHMNAISDFSKLISLEPDNAEAIFNRAYSYEQILKYDDAIRDYKKLSVIAEDDEKAMEMLDEAEKRLFELKREHNKPDLVISNPAEKPKRQLNIPRDENVIPIVGMAMDESDIKSIYVNNMNIPFTKKEDGFEFLTSVNVSGMSELKVEIIDVYDNTEAISYNILRTEVKVPKIRIIAPYASDNNVIYLDSNNPMIYVEGTINDESLISSIYIDDVVASYVPDDKNPNFQAMINITNKNHFTVKAKDAFGNVAVTTFEINREAVALQDGNPMGKTWVVFIENSNYESFASLDGPPKDITLMKTALAKYSIHNFIHKKNQTKQQLEKFFAIELRDLLRSNRVNSLLVWYAGHGKFVNETGYWVPVDAKRDDEFTYFNINALKASMQSYPINVNHTLVITDACESGPSFYQAMRSDLQDRDCNDPSATRLKSSQVFSSAGYELAVDNSQFTRTFANVLANSNDGCVPIESIVRKVTDAVFNSNQQKPQFGKIAGLEDENGTFFFIAK